LILILKFALYPDSNFSTLYYTRLKLGFNTKHSDKWSFYVLPILSSDYQNTGTTNIYMGGAILTYKKHRNFNYKFYVGNEAWFYITPL
jgi:hypothetical protein